MIRQIYFYVLVFLGCTSLLFASAILSYGFIISVPKSTKTVYSYSSEQANTLTQVQGAQSYLFTEPNAQQQTNDTVRIVLVGDMMFQYPLDEMVVHSGANPFDYVRDYFNTFDITMGSLETNIAPWSIGTAQNKPFTFRAPVAAIDRLKNAGFEIVTVANNHTMDYGSEAFSVQLDLLRQAGILTTGGGNTVSEAFAPRYIETKGTKIAFIAVNGIETEFQNVTPNRAGTAYFDEGLLRQSLWEARQNADVVIVYAHWGMEHQYEPTQFQRSWGRFFIDNGADLVLGSHPHIRQGSEIYNGKPIFYSLGNFVYTGMGWKEDSTYGSMLEVVINNKQLSSTQLRTIKMTYHGYPDPIDF
jgi:poly-gamma-glutamate capsule biosynthesis protein CapA/YwtB (metallophosphatase superfamily)